MKKKELKSRMRQIEITLDAADKSMKLYREVCASNWAYEIESGHNFLSQLYENTMDLECCVMEQIVALMINHFSSLDAQIPSSKFQKYTGTISDKTITMKNQCLKIIDHIMDEIGEEDLDLVNCVNQIRTRLEHPEMIKDDINKSVAEKWKKHRQTMNQGE